MSATSGVGMPGALLLDEFGAVCADFFGAHVYHVGSSTGFSRKKTYRDVDVRVILTDDEYAALGLGDPEHPHHNRRWVALTLAFSALGRQMTGLPIDFQVQQQTYANKKFPKGRSALGIIALMRRQSNVPHDLFAKEGKE